MPVSRTTKVIILLGHSYVTCYNTTQEITKMHSKIQKTIPWTLDLRI